MAERPIILFGEKTFAPKTTKGGFPTSNIKMPDHTRQVSRLAPKMTILQNALLTLQRTPDGIEPEKVLVFELAKDLESFYTAVRKIGDGIELIFDAPEDMDVSDDFYIFREDKKTGKVTKREEKTLLNGKVYCVLTNARALEEMLGLWTRYGQDPQTKFPRGKAGLKHVFDCLIDIHIWGYKERIEETGILEAWKDDLNEGSVKCEIELFFRKSYTKRQECEQNLIDKIKTIGGDVIGRSMIEDISYHAILATLPRNVAEQIAKNDESISLLSAEQIMFFRPVGQNVYSNDGVAKEDSIVIPDADNINEEPIIALFDGIPQENHPFLSNRLIVDDPDDYASQYTVSARKHGTSMASLITLGDISNPGYQATHKIYVRPIMKPLATLNDTREEIPGDILLVDKVHEAVRRLFVPGAGAVSPKIKVINLSIGISYRQFDRAMSPLARLLDWLSYKYRVLFVISAGNHNSNLDIGVPFSTFQTLDMNTRDARIIEWINNNARNRRLLSPSESVNSLTVGATFEDGTTSADSVRTIFPCSNGMLSPISALGKGLNNSIKPDIVFPGGRNTVFENITNPETLVWRESSQREPGVLSAAPFNPGSTIKVAYNFGTSNSAALISHEASRCYDALTEVFDISNTELPSEYIALLIKAMLVHGAEWGALKDKFTQTLGFTRRNNFCDVLHRFIGYGKPDIDKAIECSKERITLIGYGELNNGEAHLYNLPLPFNFTAERISRRFTATLTYFTPIVPSRQEYREAKIWYEVEGRKPHLIESRIDLNYKAVTRGTVQHEIFENDEIVAWGEDDAVQIKVNCGAVVNDNLSGAIPYALMVSFEIKSDIDVDVYTKIAEKIRPRITV
ncbi:MAG: S8 family peptidase [Chitinispirillales bacterium]|jgi:hypothetical protein|nr:S8 family peptidase [Chitinispirillales bacterium]